jgi:hypothetical protein
MSHYDGYPAGDATQILPTSPAAAGPILTVQAAAPGGVQSTAVTSVQPIGEPFNMRSVLGETAQTAPTQTVYHWRAVVRTVVAMALGFLPLLPEVLLGLHLDGTAIGAQVIVAGAAVTRVLAMSDVEVWLKTWAPWLSAQPPLSHQDGMAGR